MKLHNPKLTLQPASKKVILPENLVFCGGGIKGLAYSGVLQALDQKGLLKGIKRFAGASAGAITASLLAIGMSAEDIKNQMDQVDFSSFLQKSNVNIQKIADNPKHLLDPIIGAKFVYDEIEHKGLCDVSGFYNWLKSMFNSKGFDEVTTFSDLYLATKKELHVALCSMNYCKTVIANYENTPDMPVMTAVRGSMSIPFVFQPMVWKDDTYVDGGTMYNYPIEVFDHETDPEKTLGFILSTSDEVLNPQKKTDNNIIEHLERFLTAVMNVSYEYCFRLGNQYRTVFIDTAGIGTLDFSLTPEQKKLLSDNGYNAVQKYFSVYA